MSAVERACTSLALHYLENVDAEVDPLRRLGILDCALDALQGARTSLLARCAVPEAAKTAEGT